MTLASVSSLRFRRERQWALWTRQHPEPTRGACGRQRWSKPLVRAGFWDSILAQTQAQRQGTVAGRTEAMLAGISVPVTPRTNSTGIEVSGHVEEEMVT